jgi:hypothetical protein
MSDQPLLTRRYDRRVLFESADGPDGICLYTSEERSAVDFSGDFPSLYLEVAVMGAHVTIGPFMKSIRLDLEAALNRGEEPAP